MNRYYRQALVILVLIILFATTAYANAGIPMLAFVLPGMAISLVPIILIEAWCIGRLLNLSFTKAMKVMGIANLESTFIGIPITWVIWVVVEMLLGYFGYRLSDLLGISVPHFINYVFALTIGAAWLGPSEAQDYWMVPAATLVLLVPFFYVSWLLERRRTKLLLHDCDASSVNGATLKANIASYGLLGIIVIGWLIISVIEK